MATILILVAIMVALIAATITLAVIKNKKSDNDKIIDAHFTISVICIVLCLTIGAVLVTATVMSNTNNKYDVLDSRYEQLVDTYELYVIQTRTNTNAWLEEVYKYNKDVLELKAEANNKWTNCFVNKNRAKELKLIEFENGRLKLYDEE